MQPTHLQLSSELGIFLLFLYKIQYGVFTKIV
jgi:hypothetical protein